MQHLCELMSLDSAQVLHSHSMDCNVLAGSDVEMLGWIGPEWFYDGLAGNDVGMDCSIWEWCGDEGMDWLGGGDGMD